ARRVDGCDHGRSPPRVHLHAVDRRPGLFMTQWQVQFEAALASATNVAAFMQLPWSWPIVESVHFIGLTLLLGSIAAWDLRLLGLMSDVPVAAFHRLVPFAVAGFVVNVAS